MRDVETILFGLIWGIGLIIFVVAVLIVYNLKLFPSQRLKNLRFSEIKIGQVFYDYGGEELKLRKYIKTGEIEARCLSVPDYPLVNFAKIDLVKIEILAG